MKLALKMYLMCHGIARPIVTDDALVFYRTFARRTGRQLSRKLNGYTLV